MCLYPRLIRNKKYEPNTKNGGIVPPVLDERCLYVPVGCQNCMECRKKKSREWQVRLQEDIREHRNGKFITLTFNDEAYRHYAKEFDLEGYELDNEIAVRAVRLFLERWRKKYKKSLRHWLVTELGHNGTENVHLHGIVWTDDIDEVERIWNSGEHGPNGYVWKGKETWGKDGYRYLQNYVNERTVNYIVKYVSKVDEDHKYYKSRVLTSKGIGRGYTKRPDSNNNRFKGKDTVEFYKTRSGHKIAMPIYWRNKIYSEEERERLWLIKLDKEERWVCGNKVSVAKNDKAYLAMVKVARDRNRRLGYGSNEVDMELKAYEIERRKVMQLTRFERAKRKEQERDCSPQGSYQKG